MATKLVYLASPYSKYPYGTLRAFEEVCTKAAQLMKEGHNIFCPIAHSHPIETIGMTEKGTHDFWLKQDFAVLEKCEALFVYMMPGWQESYGVNKEIELAQKNNIPITYLEYE